MSFCRLILDKNKSSKKSTSSQQEETPQTIQEARAIIQSSMVGSQKRKARKESITRLDIKTTTNNDNNNTVFGDETEPSNDLLILATLAVEADKTKDTN